MPVNSFCTPRSTSTLSYFFFNDTAPTEIYTLSLHDALPIFLTAPLCGWRAIRLRRRPKSRNIPGSDRNRRFARRLRSEEHTSELQSLTNLVCRLLLEKKKKQDDSTVSISVVSNDAARFAYQY